MFDRKDLSDIMVTPSFGDSLKSGAIKGATFGGLNIQDDKGRFTAITLSYLEKERPNEVCDVDKAETQVALAGFEQTTFGLLVRRATNLRYSSWCWLFCQQPQAMKIGITK
jgi:hypothetical protein